MSGIDAWIGIPCIIAQLVTVFFLVRHRQHKEFPIFLQYIVLQVAATIGLYPLYRMAYTSHTAYAAYFYAYWAISAVSAFIGFAVIHEIFKNVFKPFDALRDLASILFRWALLVVVLVAGVLAFTDAGVGHTRLIAAILSVERSVLVMQGGVLLFLMLFSQRLALSWKHHGFGIAVGFGFYACGQLVNNMLFDKLGPSFSNANSAIEMWLTAIQAFIWLAYLASPEPARVTVESAFAPKPILQRWDAVLGGRPLATQGAFLVNLEKIVDQVMEERPTGTR